MKKVHFITAGILMLAIIIALYFFSPVSFGPLNLEPLGSTFHLKETPLNSKIYQEYVPSSGTYKYYEVSGIADPETFEVLTFSFTKDKKYVYSIIYKGPLVHQTKILAFADSASFESLGDGVFQDKNHRYKSSILHHPQKIDEYTLEIIESD